MFNHIFVYTVSIFYLNCYHKIFFKIEIKSSMAGYMEERTGMKTEDIYMYVASIHLLQLRGKNSKLVLFYFKPVSSLVFMRRLFKF